MEEMKKVSWNVAEGLIYEISNRRSSANTWFISGNIRRAFNTLTSMKQSVIQSFSSDERNKLKVIEMKFSKISFALTATLSSSFDTKHKNIYRDAYKLALKFYNKYNDLLMDLLEERGYLIGERQDASKMKFF